jgi:hypothetical protein
MHTNLLTQISKEEHAESERQNEEMLFENIDNIVKRLKENAKSMEAIYSCTGCFGLKEIRQIDIAHYEDIDKFTFKKLFLTKIRLVNKNNYRKVLFILLITSIILLLLFFVTN